MTDFAWLRPLLDAKDTVLWKSHGLTLERELLPAGAVRLTDKVSGISVLTLNNSRDIYDGAGQLAAKIKARH